jgi:ferredoxin--NADP+ reductase
VAGRVQHNGSVVIGAYVVGWIKRGPTGVIGTNKGDAKETVEQLLGDLDSLPRASHRDPDAIIERLSQRGVGVVSWAGWEAIDAAEQALGAAAGRTRIKIADRAALLVAAAKALCG